MQILKVGLIVLFIVVTALFGRCLVYGEVNWQDYGTDHFIIYYHKEVPRDYVEQAAIKAEEYYQSIAVNLGFNRYEFWLWDERAKIYIFKDAQEYRIETGQPAWSGGCAVMRKKIIKTYPWSEGFFNKLLPHELGHIMFREFVGFRNNIPLWLDEGVAILQEKSEIKNYSLALKGLRMTIPINKLNKINSNTLILPEIFYTQSASIIDYLLTKFGKDSFVQFCKRLRNGQTFDGAISSVYHFSDLKKLNEAWLEYVKSL